MPGLPAEQLSDSPAYPEYGPKTGNSGRFAGGFRLKAARSVSSQGGIILSSWRDCLAEVRLQEGESIENALRRFKRKVQTEDIIKEVKRHSYYLKPGEKRRVKQALARKRAKKKVRKDRDSRPDRD
jgi:small subunit ribosomal protein S21